MSAITAEDLPDGTSILLVIHEGIYFETANNSLLSEFQLKEFRVQKFSRCHRHGRTQQMVIAEESSMLPVPLDLAGCMARFKHRLPTSEECESLKRYRLNLGDIPENVSAFSDQMGDKFYQQVLNNEHVSTSLNSKSDLSPDTVKLSPKKVIPYLSYIGPSDVSSSILNERPVSPVFHADSVQKADIEILSLNCSEPHYSKVVPGNIDYEKLSPYFAFRPHTVIWHTLQQTTKYAKSTIHFPLSSSQKLFSDVKDIRD